LKVTGVTGAGRSGKARCSMVREGPHDSCNRRRRTAAG
jgi:hypothetical protein